MRYLIERDLHRLGIRWVELIDIIRHSVGILKNNQYAQPIKVYLRYNDPLNRIIAMPAYLGGEIQTAGLKWIASFPDNLSSGLPRAHSTTILNNALSGKPIAIINTAYISGLRTAAVSGFIIKNYLNLLTRNTDSPINVGIIGLGPIGVLHIEMLQALLEKRLNKMFVFDITYDHFTKNNPDLDRHKIIVADSIHQLHENVNILITCTASKVRYLDLLPRKGSLYLNVSLRDFTTHFLRHVDIMLVDSWEEVCRENTDIEMASKEFGLTKADVLEIIDLDKLSKYADLDSKAVMFNPMGMAVFDLALAHYYYQLAITNEIGLELEAHDLKN
jgi:2,3-diaminopropionate biosynthesis protein SbnB